MKTNVARTSKGDTLEMEDRKGKTEKKLDMDKENNKKNIIMAGRKNAETGMNTFDNPSYLWDRNTRYLRRQHESTANSRESVLAS